MSDFSSIDQAISGGTVSFKATSPTIKSSFSIDPNTGNPPYAPTNSGTLASGIVSQNNFGQSMPQKLMSGDGSLQNIISGVVTDPASSRYLSKSTELTDGEKRLNVIRSRASRSLYSSSGSSYSSDRGPISFMRLLKNKDYDPLKSVSASVDVKTEIQQLLSDKATEGFTKFFLTGVNVSHSEKTQILTTFGDNEVVYYFGKQPTIFNFSGILFDSIESDWFTKFLTLYQRVLRGTELARNFALVELTLPNMKLIGTISGLTHQQESSRDTDISFTMQFIAKEVEPLPMEMPKGTASNMVGTLVDFKANRSGVGSWGMSLSSGSLGGGFMQTIPGAGFGLDLFGGLGDITKSIGGTLTSFRTSIFSPVFGIISSITKIIKNVTGSISKIISSFTNPLNQIIRDITGFANKAGSIVNLVENSINSVFSIPNRTVSNFNTMIRALKKNAGIISRAPEDISEIFKRQFSSGSIRRGAPILSSGKKRKKGKAAVLSSGHPYVPQLSYRI